MLEGKCPKCDARYYGWALANPRNQTCKCGAALIIFDENTSIKGYSPFEAEKYVFGNQQSNAVPADAKKNSPRST
jgi:hypothetical protein